MSAWSLAEMPDLTGRVFVVTGATSGIGLVVARELAERGAYVVLACRDVERAREVRGRLAPNTEVRRLDLSDFDSVRAFAQELSDWRIETLINNAGVLFPTLERTPDGREIQFATNVLGHFLLTQLLLRQHNLTDRVVWLTSGAHRAGGLDLDDLDWRRRPYRTWQAYGASKLADLMLAYELQRRFTGSGAHLRSMAAHPGFSGTRLFDRHGDSLRERMAGQVIRLSTRIPALSQPPDKAALPVLYAATVPDLPGGTYVGPGGWGELTGDPRPVGSSAASHDRQMAARLWRICEKLTGLR
ncbi:MAG: oxidoreductase [Dermatophilaceae bacterium]